MNGEHMEETLKKYYEMAKEHEREQGEHYEKEAHKYLKKAREDTVYAEDDSDTMTVFREFELAFISFSIASSHHEKLTDSVLRSNLKYIEMDELRYRCRLERCEFLLNKVKFSFFGGLSGKSSERLEFIYDELVTIASHALKTEEHFAIAPMANFREKLLMNPSYLNRVVLNFSSLYYRCADILKKAGRNSSAEHIISTIKKLER